jgi:hypothetical protein
MRKSILALSVVLAIAAFACGSEGDGSGARTEVLAPPAESTAPPAEGASAASPALLLRTIEDIGAELSQRAAAGTLTAEWAEAWSQACAVRGQAQVASLIALVDAGATSGDLLAVGAEAFDLYFQSYEPVFLQLEKQHANRTLDGRLAALRSNWLSVAERVAQSGDSDQRASTWCCRARTIFSDSWDCHTFKTLGVWAAAKCSGYFAGVPLVDGIRLSKQACSSVAECQ